VCVCVRVCVFVCVRIIGEKMLDPIRRGNLLHCLKAYTVDTHVISGLYVVLYEL